MFPVIVDIVPRGNAAFDWGWHEVILEPKDGAKAMQLKLRYYKTWAREPDGAWKIDFPITNRESLCFCRSLASGCRIRHNEIARKFGLVFRLPEDLQKIYQSMGADLEKYNGDAFWELPADPVLH